MKRTARIVSLLLALLLTLSAASVSLAADYEKYTAQYLTNNVLELGNLTDNADNRALVVILAAMEYVKTGGSIEDLDFSDTLAGYYNNNNLDVFIRKAGTEKYINLFFTGEGDFYLFEYGVSFIQNEDAYKNYQTSTTEALAAAVSSLED